MFKIKNEINFPTSSVPRLYKVSILAAVLFLLVISFMQGILRVSALEGPVMASTTPGTHIEQIPEAVAGARVSRMVEGKTYEEKVQIKSLELSNLSVPIKYDSDEYGISIEIQKIIQIEGGIEVLVKAWKDGKPLGFGAYGTVETERIRIINPPVLVREDGNLKEDLKMAAAQSVAHTVSIIGRGGDHIVPGKIGNTTTTVYPGTGSGGTTSDGRMFEDRYTSWNSTLTSTSCRVATVSDTVQDFINALGNGNGSTYYSNMRFSLGFDTSPMPDTDGIALATFSIYGTNGDASAGSERRVYLVSSSPASNGTLATTDYDNVGTTSLGVTDGTWNTSGYNNIPLNTSGLAYINKTGVTNFALRGWYDMNGSAPDNSNELYIYMNFADQTGTANDPKLVIEHATCS